MDSVWRFKGLNQATVSRCIKRFTRRISAHSRNYIKFPHNEEGLQETQNLFKRIANFPNVTGCIDCSHISIINPGGPYAELFRNRKELFQSMYKLLLDRDWKSSTLLHDIQEVTTTVIFLIGVL
ncbi:hypothetical protein NQ314_015742 [Rhamnusium bicolor]|uniref:Nuclease HARBI1 n=1 Tax=Rhamnusium bicolor TaxID=1586634 RepID=A0AAV8WXN0_9CUCU|nr:hypothetical protein NQ314_015742 [Rhamnusium bicolor]